MNSRDEKLVFQEICARIPYGIKCEYEYKVETKDGKWWDKDLVDITQINLYNRRLTVYNKRWDEPSETEVDSLKPLLRPMSLRTEEEISKMESLGPIEYETFCYSHNLDHRGLIVKGLAINIGERSNEYREAFSETKVLDMHGKPLVRCCKTCDNRRSWFRCLIHRGILVIKPKHYLCPYYE